ncbi:diguanylate cyclase [Candidatus Obscuribacterales bacterium]|jgi:GGDEF domain-containing protein|nr:diguanylate cyclase [Candidatus Obscuribacterales bacterium]
MPLDDNSSSGASLRLGKLSNIPGTADLDFALEQAKKNTSAVIELPWKSQSSPTFLLKVSCFPGEDDANWVLYQGETADAAVLWSFDSDDTTLIESLIVAECGAERSVTAALPAKSQTVSQLSGTNGGLQAGGVPAPPAVPQLNLPPPVEFDRALVDEIDRNLRNPETGFITRAGFFYFMAREYSRYEAFKTPMAVIVFELLANYGGDKIMPMPERALKEAFRRFQSVMKGVDIVSHYKERQFAFILPGSTSNDAIQFGQKVEKVLMEGPLQPGLDANQGIFCAGVASIPDTCEHPGIVLAACEKALAQAKERKTSLALFSAR